MIFPISDSMKVNDSPWITTSAVFETTVSGRCLGLFLTSHTLIPGRNLSKMESEKCIKAMYDLYFGVACTQAADTLKTQNVHLSQQMCWLLKLRAETVEEPCRDFLEFSSSSLKPMANVK